MTTAYEILDLPPEATPDEVQQAYNERAAELTDSIDDTIEFQQIQEAYELINTPEKQSEYRQKLLPQPVETDLPDLTKTLKMVAANCILQEVPAPRPGWTEPRVVAPSRALILAPARSLKRKIIYEYIRDQQNKNQGWARLDLRRRTPSLIIDYSNPKNILAAIELAKALRGTGLKIPENLKPEIQAEIRKQCAQHGLTVSTYPVLRPAARKVVTDALEQAYKTPIPRLVRTHLT